jgi:nicotinate-nucleotide adenylyltransferase
MNIGIFGGTFNPVHFAHLRIAEEIRESFGLEKVIFMPAATPPHKPLADDLSFEERFNMVALSIEGNPLFSVSDLEGKREGKSYSIDTLRALESVYPGDELFFIMGSDSFNEIGSWKEFAAIFSCCNIVAIARPGSALCLQEALPVAITHEFCYHEAGNRLEHKSGHSVYSIEGTQLDISSTAIRSKIFQGKSIKYLVPEAVERYIIQQRLYARINETRTDIP